jgi:hypothetical protein
VGKKIEKDINSSDEDFFAEDEKNEIKLWLRVIKPE